MKVDGLKCRRLITCHLSSLFLSLVTRSLTSMFFFYSFIDFYCEWYFCILGQYIIEFTFIGLYMPSESYPCIYFFWSNNVSCFIQLILTQVAPINDVYLELLILNSNLSDNNDDEVLIFCYAILRYIIYR